MLEEANQLYCGLTYCFWLENSDILRFSDFLKEKLFRPWFETNKQTNTIFMLNWCSLFWLEVNEVFALLKIKLKVRME